MTGSIHYGSTFSSILSNTSKTSIPKIITPSLQVVYTTTQGKLEAVPNIYRLELLRIAPFEDINNCIQRFSQTRKLALSFCKALYSLFLRL